MGHTEAADQSVERVLCHLGYRASSKLHRDPLKVPRVSVARRLQLLLTHLLTRAYGPAEAAGAAACVLSFLWGLESK